MKFNKQYKLLLTGLLALALSACGGGEGGPSTGDTISVGGGGDTTPPPVLVSGTFVDSPVNGLDYSGLPSGTGGVTGDTGTIGGFQVEEGDTVTFSIAGISLGSSLGAVANGTIVTPAELAGNKLDASNGRAIRIARLLQSLDDDGDTSNGISITEATKTVVAALSSAERDDLTATLISGTNFDTVFGGLIDDMTATNTAPRTAGDLVSAVAAEVELLAAVNEATGGAGSGTDSNITAAATGNCPVGSLASTKKTVFGQDFPVCVLTEDITNDVTLTNDHLYVLQNAVNVGDGDRAGGPTGSNNAVLTIEPGTQIFGYNGFQIVLAITRGSRISAIGTPDLPIIMAAVNATGLGTALQITDDPADLTGRGQWGGLVLSGFGENNKCFGNEATSSEVATEAAPDGVTRFYGCNNNADDSGDVEYLIIAESGLEFRPDEEVQGLTLEAVGSGTKLNFIQVLGSDDDGIEWFGGGVSISNLVVNGAEDDGIDFDEGIRATVQKAIIIVGATKGDEGIEADSAGPSNDATPVSRVNFVNTSFLGNAGSQDPSGLNFKVGFGGAMWRSAIVDDDRAGGAWDDCMDLDNQIDTFTAFRDVAVKCANGDQGTWGFGVAADSDTYQQTIASGGNDESGQAISDERRDFTLFTGNLNANTLAVDPGVSPNNPGTLPDPVNGTPIGNYFGAIDPASGNPDGNPNNNGAGGGPFWDGWTYRNAAVEGNLPGSNFHPLQAEIQPAQ